MLQKLIIIKINVDMQNLGVVQNDFYSSVLISKFVNTVFIMRH